MKQQVRHILAGAVLVGLVVLVAIGVFNTNRLQTVSVQPVGIMSTTSNLEVVVPAGKAEQSRVALASAEAALRDTEARLSAYLNASEISRFNQAPAGEMVELSEPVREVLALARQMWLDSGGAFDVTLSPILQAWRDAAAQDRVPTQQELAAARAASSWDQIVLGERGAIKLADSVRVDLGGIGKGYGVDRAVVAMMQDGVVGGLVAVGGDIRVFGQTDRRQSWRVGVRNPFAPEQAEPMLVLRLSDGAVSTSGHYFRYSTIQAKQYSHIKDPRPGPTMGTSVNGAASVTVVAPTSVLADAWATALSVLGPEGLRLLDEAGEIKALMIVGSPEHYQVLMSDGMESLLAEPIKPQSGMTVLTSQPATTQPPPPQPASEPASQEPLAAPAPGQPSAIEQTRPPTEPALAPAAEPAAPATRPVAAPPAEPAPAGTPDRPVFDAADDAPADAPAEGSDG